MSCSQAIFYAKAMEYARRSGHPKTSFLLYTGLDQKMEPVELEKCGVDSMVKKPVSCAELLRIVQKLIQKQ